jgi:rhodanese-related sulfurtransferase
VKTIAVADFAARLHEGAQAFDTRPLAQYEKDALPGAHHLSLEGVQAGQLPDLALDKPVYLICERGLMSDLVALYLEAAGFSEVYNVAGGMVAWRRAQLELSEPQATTEP